MQIRPYVKSIAHYIPKKQGIRDKQFGDAIEYMVKRIARYIHKIFKIVLNVLYNILDNIQHRKFDPHNVAEIMSDINRQNTAHITKETNEHEEQEEAQCVLKRHS